MRILAVVGIILLTRCTSPSQEAYTYLELTPIDTIRITKPDRIGAGIDYFELHEFGGVEYLQVINNLERVAALLPLRAGPESIVYSFRQHLSNISPGGVCGATFLSPDSIVIVIWAHYTQNEYGDSSLAMLIPSQNRFIPLVRRTKYQHLASCPTCNVPFTTTQSFAWGQPSLVQFGTTIVFGSRVFDIDRFIRQGYDSIPSVLFLETDSTKPEYGHLHSQPNLYYSARLHSRAYGQSSITSNLNILWDNRIALWRPHKPEIWVYYGPDYATHQVYSLPSLLQREATPYPDETPLFRNRMWNNADWFDYQAMRVDSTTKRIYRLVRQANSTEPLATNEDVYSLAVFDSAFQFLGEGILPSDLGPFFFPYKGGVLLQHQRLSKQNGGRELVFVHYNLKFTPMSSADDVRAKLKSEWLAQAISNEPVPNLVFRTTGWQPTNRGFIVFSPTYFCPSCVEGTLQAILAESELKCPLVLSYDTTNAPATVNKLVQQLRNRPNVFLDATGQIGKRVIKSPEFYFCAPKPSTGNWASMVPPDDRIMKMLRGQYHPLD
jgi:hypothetical protein